MLDYIEKQKPVTSLFSDDGKDMGGFHEVIDVCLEDEMKGEEHTAQAMSCIDNPKNRISKALNTRFQLMHVNYCKEKLEMHASTEVTPCNYFVCSHNSARFSPCTF